MTTSQTNRFTSCGITLDISRQKIESPQLAGLIELAQKRKVIPKFHAMIRGEVVNTSENRSVLHTSLRSSNPDAPLYVEVQSELQRVLSFAEHVRSGQWCGCKGDQITDIVNVGIGGSDIGPKTIYHALHEPQDEIRLHFLTAADPILFNRTIANLNPFKTLVVVSSKSCKTRETLINTKAIDQWLESVGIVKKDRQQHMVVVSANSNAAQSLSLPQENQFNIWDWVGGRFSVWSAIGLPVAIALGPEVFKKLLTGAEEMDKHAASAPLNQNLPALMAILSYWNTNHNKMTSHCVLPYDERLRMFVFWLQQLEMESLGKVKKHNGQMTNELTSQCIWGGIGNESQHSFFQCLREGTLNTSIAIIYSKKPGNPLYGELHRVLIANAKAQMEALVTRNDEASYTNSVAVLEIDDLTPERLGALMALYEHKTAMLAALLELNAFDQPGVELGKILSLRAESLL